MTRYIGAMSLFRLLALLILVFAFIVLVWTFVWVARLLAARQAGAVTLLPGQAPGLAAATATAPHEAVAAAAQAAEAQTAAAQAAAAQAAEAEAQRRRTGVGVNATLGLVLSALACAGFWLSPLVLVLSAAGVWFSGSALWAGLSRYRVFLGRAGLGLVLGIVSVIAVFAWRMGMLQGALSL